MKKLIQLKDKNNNNYDPINTNYEKRLKNLQGTILFESYEGTIEDVSLSDSATNYTCFEIFYKSLDGTFASVKVYSPNNKLVNLNCTWTDGTLYFKFKNVYISNNSIVNRNYGEAYLNSNAQYSNNERNCIYITKVIGYK